MKVLLTGGGTAGHITPLLAVAKELRARDEHMSIAFVGQKDDPNLTMVRSSMSMTHIYGIRAGKFRRYHGQSLLSRFFDVRTNALNLRDVLYTYIGLVQAIKIVKKEKPDVVFTKGGFVGVPVCLAARILRVPYVTHDSDSMPGLANRLIASHAAVNLVSFTGIKAYPENRQLVVGVPVADEYYDRRRSGQSGYKKQLGIPEDYIHVFVYTGTQGSKTIDDELESFMPALMLEYPKLYLTIVYGRLNEQSMHNRYQDVNNEVRSRLRTLTFTDEAANYIASADIVIGRAGATTMVELATIGRACIIVPADHLTGGHQVENARLLAEKKAIVMVREKDLHGGLERELRALVGNETQRHMLERAIMDLATEPAARKISEVLQSIATGTFRL